MTLYFNPVWYGESRVVCFSPDRSKTLPLLTVEEILAVVKVWQEQLEELAKNINGYKFLRIKVRLWAALIRIHMDKFGQIVFCLMKLLGQTRHNEIISINKVRFVNGLPKRERR